MTTEDDTPTVADLEEAIDELRDELRSLEMKGMRWSDGYTYRCERIEALERKIRNMRQ